MNEPLVWSPQELWDLENRIVSALLKGAYEPSDLPSSSPLALSAAAEAAAAYVNEPSPSNATSHCIGTKELPTRRQHSHPALPHDRGFQQTMTDQQMKERAINNKSGIEDSR